MNDLPQADTDICHFDGFELSPRWRTLSHGGKVVALRPTVFAVLLHLLQNPGRLVTKDELFEAVWPQRIVEEANLTQTVFDLRTALRGAGGAEADRLIATVRGRGYRFVGEVRRGPPEPATASPLDASPAQRPPEARIPRVALAIGGVILLVAGLAGVGFWTTAHRLRPGNTIVLADVQNRTHDPIFDRTLSSVLRVDVGQSPYISVMPEKTAQDTLALMTRPKDTPITPALAQEICARGNADAVLGGEVDAVDAQYIVTLNATDCSGQRVLAQEKAEVRGRDAVVPALDRLIGRVRNRLGEPIASVDRYNVPLAPARTASLDALKAYSEGVWLNDHGRQAEAVPALRQAIELDPRFAAAYATLGLAYSIINVDDLAAASTARAYELRNDLNEREKLRVENFYNLITTRDLAAATRVLQRWTAVYPMDSKAWANLANIEVGLGQYAQAREDARQALALHAVVEASYVVAARADVGSGHPDEARVVGEQAVRQGLDGPSTHRELMEAALMLRDAAALQRELQWSHAHPGLHTLTTEAEMAYSAGQIRSGDRAFAALTDFTRQHGLPDGGLSYRARLLIDVGLPDQARRLLAGQADFSDRDLVYALAEVGDPAKVEAAVRGEVGKYPQGTLANNIYAPEARAALALRRRDPPAAIAALKPGLTYQSANLDMSYVLGGAYLAGGDGPDADKAFRMILDHQGWRASSPLYPLARLGLARALVLEHNRPAAKTAYAQFFAAWKDADPDVPILAAAKREATALN